MFKFWTVKFFQGGYLKSLYPLMSKQGALSLMSVITDAHCIKCIKGFFKGQVIYKYPKSK